MPNPVMKAAALYILLETIAPMVLSASVRSHVPRLAATQVKIPESASIATEIMLTLSSPFNVDSLLLLARASL